MKTRIRKLVVHSGTACLVLELAFGCGGDSFSSSAGSGGISGSSGGGAIGLGGQPAAGGTGKAGGSGTTGIAGADTAGATGTAGIAGTGTAGSTGTAGVGGTGSAGHAGAGGGAGVGAGGSGAGGSGGATGCSPACGPSRQCCAGQCVNDTNDPHNCGACGTTCDSTTYCGAGKCIKPPCTATTCTGNTCCGTECCSAGMLCCDAAGPLDNGPHCTMPSAQGSCPVGCAPACVCASPDTPIATPQGERAVATLRVGDLVYSVEGNAVKAVPIVRVNHTEVSNHHVMRVRLATGAKLEISGGHPTADGRTFADLRAGTTLDGVSVVAVERVPYAFTATYDILPGSSSGTYFAGGALIGSTLSGAEVDGARGACVGVP